VKEFNFSGYNLQTKIFWGLMLLSSVAVFALSVYASFSFSIPQFTVISVTLIISVLVNRQQFAIPQTKVKIRAQEFIIFWTIIWLGVSAGVLVAAASALAGYIVASRDKKQWLLGVSVNIIAAFAAAKVFYYLLKSFAGFTGGTAVADNPLDLIWLLTATGLMTLTHYVLTALLNSLFFQLEDTNSFSEIWKEKFLGTIANYSISVFATFVLHFAFVQFGLLFGWVILPVTIFAHVAYRIHVSRLAHVLSGVYPCDIMRHWRSAIAGEAVCRTRRVQRRHR
jgi:hypothetical protein